MWGNLVDNEKMGEKNLVEVMLKGQALMMKKGVSPKIRLRTNIVVAAELPYSA